MTDERIVYFYNKKYQLESLPCEDCRAVFNYSDKRMLLKAISYAWSIVQIMFLAMKMRPRVVHVQWFRWFAVDAIMVRWLRCLGAKIVFTAHNVTPHNERKGDRARYQWYYNHVDAVIAHTESSVRELQEQFGVDEKKVHVIPHGLLVTKLRDEDVEARMKEFAPKIYKEKRPTIVFGVLGFQNLYKGVDFVIDTWLNNAALRENDDVHLLLAGKTQAADLTPLGNCRNVTIVNELLEELDFEAYMRLTDVALLPYRKISQSGVLLTTLRARIPVVVSNAGGLPDPFRYGRVGWQMGEASRENLERVMLELVAHPEEITAVATDDEAYAAVHAAYSWAAIAQTTATLYADM